MTLIRYALLIILVCGCAGTITKSNDPLAIYHKNAADDHRDAALIYKWASNVSFLFGGALATVGTLTELTNQTSAPNENSSNNGKKKNENNWGKALLITGLAWAALSVPMRFLMCSEEDQKRGHLYQMAIIEKSKARGEAQTAADETADEPAADETAP